MDQKYGIEMLKKLVVSMAEALNVASKVLHNGGILSLFGLLAPVNVLKSIDWSKAKLEISELSPEERKQLEAAFSSSLSLQDAAVQAKILAAEGFLEEAIDLVSQGVTLVNQGIGLVARARAYFGV